MFIVPNYLSDKIYAAIDAQLEHAPEMKEGREQFYEQLLSHFNEHGVIPEFSLKRNEV